MGAEIGHLALEWLDGARWVEDIDSVPGTAWLIGSGSANWVPGVGRLYLVNTASGDVYEAWTAGGAARPAGFEIIEPPGNGAFRPHGLAVEWSAPSQASWTVYVVHHGARETIEVFDLQLEDPVPTVTWIGAIPRRPGIVGNSVAPIGHGLIASFSAPGLLEDPDLLDGRVNGGLERWTAAAGWVEVPEFGCGFPNGVAASPDASHYFLADSLGAVIRAGRSGEGSTRSRLPFSPDNLRWTAQERLLTTGVRDPGGQIELIFDCAARSAPPPPARMMVAEIDPNTMDVDLILDAEYAFGLPTTALRVGSDLYVTSYTTTRLARLHGG